MCKNKGGDTMAMFKMIITIDMTIAALDATTIANAIKWVDDNIRAKLPQTCTLTVNYGMTP